jgi:hypothetical protein
MSISTGGILVGEERARGAFGTAPTNIWRFLGNRKGEPFVPFPAQAEVLSLIKTPWPGIMPNGKPYPRIFGVNCGRRFGKTTLMEKLIWAGLVAKEDFFGPPVVRVTADTDEHGRKSWDRFIWHLMNTELRQLLASYSRERELVTFVNGATAQLLSSNNPNTLAGDGVTLYLVDEAQYLSRAAWENLFPTVGERNGVIALFGVSEGDGPFREICYKGDRPDEYPEYRRLKYPTWANPYFPKEALALARREYTPARFNQLYGAEWVGESGRVFQNVHSVVDRSAEIKQHALGFFYVEEYRPGHTYYGGLDVARLQDWTVPTVFDRSGRLVAWDRFNVIDWELQKARAKTLFDHYGRALACMDSNGVGDAVFEDWRRHMRLVEYRASSNAMKQALIDKWAIRILQGRTRLPNYPPLIREHERFEARRGRSDGSTVVRYEAPAGMTDDMVMSCSLANWILPREVGPETVRVVEGGDGRQQGLWELL